MIPVPPTTPTRVLSKDEIKLLLEEDARAAKTVPWMPAAELLADDEVLDVELFEIDEPGEDYHG